MRQYSSQSRRCRLLPPPHKRTAPPPVGDIRPGACWKRCQRQSLVRKDRLLSVPQRTRAGWHPRAQAGTEADRVPGVPEIRTHTERRDAAVQSKSNVRQGCRRRVCVPAGAAASPAAQRTAAAAAVARLTNGASLPASPRFWDHRASRSAQRLRASDDARSLGQGHSLSKLERGHLVFAGRLESRFDASQALASPETEQHALVLRTNGIPVRSRNRQGAPTSRLLREPKRPGLLNAGFPPRTTPTVQRFDIRVGVGRGIIFFMGDAINPDTAIAGRARHEWQQRHGAQVGHAATSRSSGSCGRRSSEQSCRLETSTIATMYLHACAIRPRPRKRPLRDPAVSMDKMPRIAPMGVGKRRPDICKRGPDGLTSGKATATDIWTRRSLEHTVLRHERHEGIDIVTIPCLGERLQVLGRHILAARSLAAVVQF